MHKFLFYNKFIIFLYMLRALCAHHQEVKLYYTASGIVTDCRRPSGAHVRTGQVEAYNKLIIKNKILCIKLVSY